MPEFQLLFLILKLFHFYCSKFPMKPTNSFELRTLTPMSMNNYLVFPDLFYCAEEETYVQNIKYLHLLCNRFLMCNIVVILQI